MLMLFWSLQVCYYEGVIFIYKNTNPLIIFGVTEVRFLNLAYMGLLSS